MFQNYEPPANPELGNLDYSHNNSDFGFPQHGHVSQNNSSFLYNQMQSDPYSQLSYCQPYPSVPFEAHSSWSQENVYSQTHHWTPNVSESQDHNESFTSSHDVVPLETPRNDVFINLGSVSHVIKPTLFCDMDPSFGETSQDVIEDPLQMFRAQGDCSLSYHEFLLDQSSYLHSQVSETGTANLLESHGACLPLDESDSFIKQENLDFAIDELPFDNQLKFSPRIEEEVNNTGYVIPEIDKIKVEPVLSHQNGSRTLTERPLLVEEVAWPQNDSYGLSKVFGTTGVTCDGRTFLKLRLKRRIAESILECASCPKGLAEFTLLNQLSKHIAREHCTKQLICLICKPDAEGMSLMFANSDEASKHGSAAHGTGHEHCSMCEDCQIMFFSTKSLQLHLVTTHPESSTSKEALRSYKRFPCFLCLYPFKQSGHRKDHYRSVHKFHLKSGKARRTKEGPRPSPVCRKFFPDDALFPPQGNSNDSLNLHQPSELIDTASKGKTGDKLNLSLNNTAKVKRSQTSNGEKIKCVQPYKVVKVKQSRKGNARSIKNMEPNPDLRSLRSKEKPSEESASSESPVSTKSDLPKLMPLTSRDENGTKLESPKVYIRPSLISKIGFNVKSPPKKLPNAKSLKPEISPALLKRLQVVQQKFSSPTNLLNSSEEISWRKKYSDVFARKSVVSLTNIFKNVPKGEDIIRLVSPKVMLVRLSDHT